MQMTWILYVYIQHENLSMCSIMFVDKSTVSCLLECAWRCLYLSVLQALPAVTQVLGFDIYLVHIPNVCMSTCIFVLYPFDLYLLRVDVGSSYLSYHKVDTCVHGRTES